LTTIVFLLRGVTQAPSLHAILEESVGKDDSTSSEGGSSGFPISHDCHVVIPVVPIATTPLLEGTPAPLTIPTVPTQTAMPQPDTRLLLERLRAYQEEQQHDLQVDTEREVEQRWCELTVSE
jgi:hypothetical protein